MKNQKYKNMLKEIMLWKYYNKFLNNSNNVQNK